MIYRVFSKSREYLLTGTPGIDLRAAFVTFLGKLSPDRDERVEQLKGVLAHLAPDEEPIEDEIEAQAFVAVARDSLDLRAREMTEVNLDSDSIRALIGG